MSLIFATHQKPVGAAGVAAGAGAVGAGAAAAAGAAAGLLLKVLQVVLGLRMVTLKELIMLPILCLQVSKRKSMITAA